MKYLLLVLSLYLPAQFAQAQNQSQVGTTLHVIRIYEGGSLEEALSLSNEWRVKVLEKMPQFKRVSYLLQQKQENIYHLLVLRELRSSDSDVVSKSISQAIDEAFKTTEERDTFFQALNKYISRSENIVENYDLIKSSTGNL